jgi:hypothetical protein
VTFAIKSNPKIGSRKRVVPGYTSVDRAAEYLQQVKIAKAVGWPLCARCVRQRDIGLGAAGVLLLGGLAVLAGAFVFGVVGEPAVLVLMLLFFGGFAAMLLSVLPFQRVSLGRLSLAYVTADGSAVHVSNPSPEFAAELPPVARVVPDAQ